MARHVIHVSQRSHEKIGDCEQSTVLAMPNHFMKIIFSKARLHEIQTDPSTFCSEPDGMK